MLEANASAKLELARHETRAAEALAAKDAQLMRFRGELDSLLDALRAAVADKARAQAAVSEKLAQDHPGVCRADVADGPPTWVLLKGRFTFLWP